MFVTSADVSQKRIGMEQPASVSSCGSLQIDTGAGSNFSLLVECETKVMGTVRLTLRSVERLAAENVNWLRKQLDTWFGLQLRLTDA